ncbi:MAG: type IV-A pilus assembly ATPase PilB [Deltaproteobacteria bacterium]|nr:type IV-A pilus assembly ATPase PilB [Deltaproteobacteria bacterium]
MKLGEELVAAGYIGGKQLQEALKIQRTSGGDFYDRLVEKGYIDERTLAMFIAGQKNLPYISLDDIEIDPEVMDFIPEKVIRRSIVLPIGRNDGRELTVAMANPLDLSIISDIEFASGFLVVPVVSEKSSIKKAINRFYDQSKDAYADIMQVVKKEEKNLEVVNSAKEEVGSEELASAAKEAPIVRLANFIVAEAITKKTSDIHIEPYEDELRVRFRIDGVLQQVMNLSRHLQPGLSSRIKVMSGMDISERRIPQDGRMKVRVEGRTIDMRVNSIPTIFGEKIVLRILDESNLVLDLAKLGFEAQELAEFSKAIQSPYGMIVVTGPTGSGKTTTLYSALDAVNKEGTNVMTAEDPVEYYLKGINQVQMNEKAGLNFASALRSFLRQDPDVILVGEIRDLETAEIAVKAAQTGHLVLSTLHTNDAPTTIDRLINIGIPPFIVITSVILVIAQRLIRKICPSCKAVIPKIPEEKVQSLGIEAKELEGVTLYGGKGCDLCNQTGYKGRIGLYEVFPLNDDVNHLIIQGAPSSELRKAAAALGMRTIRESGIRKVKAGITTIDEVLRVSAKK